MQQRSTDEMRAVVLQRYTDADAKIWNGFVAASKNGTFLLDRNYMDYHRERFTDHSLIFRDDAGNLLGLLPAHVRNGILVSHGGLTYGGIIAGPDMNPRQMLDIFAALMVYLRTMNLRGLYYKAVPRIYHTIPADEDLFALFVNNATLMRRDLLTVLDPAFPAPVQNRRRRGAKAAGKAGVTIEESERWRDFWDILSENLAARHNLKPVHTADEMLLLRSRFPENIRLFCAIRDNQVVGGAVMYLTPQAAHVQYTASNPEGREIGALDLLFFDLVSHYADRYFDFGISNEGGGRELNHGLIAYKEGFGARTVTHDHFQIMLA